MAGSGGDTYNPGLAPPLEPDCQRLRFTTHLASLDPDVMATTKVGDLCDVVLVESAVFDVIEVWTRPDGAVLGSIVDQWAELQHCLKAGVRFVAELKSNQSPLQVEVFPRPALDCDELAAETLLYRTDADVALRVGDSLEVSVDRQRRVGERVLLTIPSTQDVVGHVRCHAVSLPDCLERGRGYRATVVSTDSDRIVVAISPLTEQ